GQGESEKQEERHRHRPSEGLHANPPPRPDEGSPPGLARPAARRAEDLAGSGASGQAGGRPARPHSGFMPASLERRPPPEPPRRAARRPPASRARRERRSPGLPLPARPSSRPSRG